MADALSALDGQRVDVLDARVRPSPNGRPVALGVACPLCGADTWCVFHPVDAFTLRWVCECQTAGAPVSAGGSPLRVCLELRMGGWCAGDGSSEGVPDDRIPLWWRIFASAEEATI